MASADSDIYLQQLSHWEIIQLDDVDRLVCTYTFKNFIDALTFANKIGELAETVNHHPVILIEWGKVEVSWWTHSINGLDKNDFIMAAKTDEIQG